MSDNESSLTPLDHHSTMQTGDNPPGLNKTEPHNETEIQSTSSSLPDSLSSANAASTSKTNDSDEMIPFKSKLEQFLHHLHPYLHSNKIPKTSDKYNAY